MDEIQKTELRNYTTAAGFFVLSLLFIVFVISVVKRMLTGSGAQYGDLRLISALLLILFGVILIVLKKRDLTAITFLMIGMLYVSLNAIVAVSALTSSATLLPTRVVTGVFFLILAAIILTSHDKKKYLLCILPLLIGIGDVITPIGGVSFIRLCIDIGIAAVALYFAFACASERIALPGGALLKADVVTDFKASGSVLGYLLVGISATVWTIVYLFNASSEVALLVDFICGAMLIFTGVLLWAVGKMRFTPVMFILMGFLMLLTFFVTGPLVYVVGAMCIVIGLFAVLRTESRILPALMLFIYGASYFIGAGAHGAAVMPVVSIGMNVLAAAIAVYLAFAVFSNRKLPLF